jgi:hypothetical protein
MRGFYLRQRCLYLCTILVHTLYVRLPVEQLVPPRQSWLRICKIRLANV